MSREVWGVNITSKEEGEAKSLGWGGIRHSTHLPAGIGAKETVQTHHLHISELSPC